MRLNKSIATVVLIGLVGAGLSVSDLQTREGTDPVIQSFERDFNREPVPTAPIRRESINSDELYRMVNSVHWTAETTTDATIDEPEGRSSDED